MRKKHVAIGCGGIWRIVEAFRLCSSWSVIGSEKLILIWSSCVCVCMFGYHPPFYTFPGTAEQASIFRMNADWMNKD